MVAYHFVWDLGNFDYIDRHFPYTLGFKSVGHGIALSFLFIAGVSLVLAHERDASFGPFWRRLARIVAAALLVTLGTYLVFPRGLRVLRHLALHRGGEPARRPVSVSPLAGRARSPRPRPFWRRTS